MKKIYISIFLLIILVISFVGYKYYIRTETKKDLQELERFVDKRSEILKFLEKTVTFQTKGYKVKSRRIPNVQKTVKLGENYYEPIEEMFKRLDEEADRPKHGMGDVKEYEF